MNWDTFQTSLSIGLISGAFVAFLTMRFALTRFYREKWWEKRANSYIQLTELIYTYKCNISILHQNSSYQRSNGAPNPLFTEQMLNDAFKENEQIKKEIIRFCELGPLVLTESSTKELRLFIDITVEVAFFFEDEESLHEGHWKLCQAAEQLFENIMNEAKLELKITSNWEQLKILFKSLTNKIDDTYSDAEQSYRDSLNGKDR